MKPTPMAATRSTERTNGRQCQRQREYSPAPSSTKTAAANIASIAPVMLKKLNGGSALPTGKYERRANGAAISDGRTRPAPAAPATPMELRMNQLAVRL